MLSTCFNIGAQHYAGDVISNCALLERKMKQNVLAMRSTREKAARDSLMKTHEYPYQLCQWSGKNVYETEERKDVTYGAKRELSKTRGIENVVDISCRRQYALVPVLSWSEEKDSLVGHIPVVEGFTSSIKIYLFKVNRTSTIILEHRTNFKMRFRCANNTSFLNILLMELRRYWMTERSCLFSG